jgi:hypothetical protein
MRSNMVIDIFFPFRVRELPNVCDCNGFHVPYASIGILWYNPRNNLVILKQFWDSFLTVQFCLRGFYFCYSQNILVTARHCHTVHLGIVCGLAALDSSLAVLHAFVRIEFVPVWDTPFFSLIGALLWWNHASRIVRVILSSHLWSLFDSWIIEGSLRRLDEPSLNMWMGTTGPGFLRCF